MRDGRLDATQACTMTEEYDHLGRFDGACTFGQVGMQWALELALPIAKERGSYAMAGADLGHIGRLAYTAQKSIGEDVMFVGMATTNGGRAAIEMDGIESLLGTNPVCIAVPGGCEPIVFDMATTEQPEGAVNVMLQQELLAPLGILRERDGRWTIDPRRLYKEPTAMLTAAGKHKGLGMGVMADASVAALVGKSHLGTDGRKTHPHGVNNVWFMLTKIPGDAHEQILRSMADRSANAKVQPGSSRRGLLPGVRGYREEMKARAGNVLIPTKIWNHVVEVHKTGKLPEEIKT